MSPVYDIHPRGQDGSWYVYDRIVEAATLTHHSPGKYEYEIPMTSPNPAAKPLLGVHDLIVLVYLA